MLLDIRTPPALTGRYNKDIPLIHDWCISLSKKVQAMFSKIENSQIISISADKITSGKIEFSGGGYFELTADGFTLCNSVGTQYIKLENDTIYVKATVVE